MPAAIHPRGAGRAPDGTAPGGRPARAGVGRAGSCSLRTVPGPLHPQPYCPVRRVVGAGSSRAAGPGATPRAGLHPAATPAESSAAWKRNAVRLPEKGTGRPWRWRPGEGQRCCCLRPHPAGVGVSADGPPSALGARPSVSHDWEVTVGHLAGEEALRLLLQHCRTVAISDPAARGQPGHSPGG